MASMKFGSVAPKCACCDTSVYKLEEMQVDKSILHKQCFKCTHCKRQLSLANFASVSGKFYCKTHFIELFHSSGGKYSVFGDGNFKMKESGSFTPREALSPATATAAAKKSPPAKASAADSPSSAAAPKDAEREVAERVEAVESKRKETIDSQSEDTIPAPLVSSSHPGGAASVLSGQGPSSPETPATKSARYKSLKERMRAYERVASSGDSNSSGNDGGSDDDAEPAAATKLRSRSTDSPTKPRSASSSSTPLPSKLRASSNASVDSLDSVDSDAQPTRKSVGTTAASPTRNASTSVSSLPEADPVNAPAPGEADELASLRKANRRLAAKVDALSQENKSLHSKVARLKTELAEQTARALESDEWCAKLSKDYEALSGSAPPSLSPVLE